jgi:hypothetical protein
MSDTDEQKFEVTEDGKLEKNEDHPANFEEDLTFDG